MSRVDQLFEESARNILEHGYREDKVKNAKVRPQWEDGDAYARYLPQQVFTYHPGEVPLITKRRTAWKTAIRELLWIYQDASNDVNLLKEKYRVHYWDAWKNEEGTLGTAYGYQMRKEFISPETGKPVRQLDRLLEQLKDNPLNRRLILTLYDVDELHDMTLIPCAFMTLWTVTENRLNMTLIQRSGDFLAAAAPGGINAFQYYVLLRMVAQVTGYEPGQFVHFIQNLHIYERHVPIVKKVMEVPANDEKITLEINQDVKDFYDFRMEDFKLVGYHPDNTKYDIPVAL